MPTPKRVLLVDDDQMLRASLAEQLAADSSYTVVEAGSIYAGVPAKKVKDVSQEMIKGEINRIANSYVKYSSWFSEINAAK